MNQVFGDDPLVAMVFPKALRTIKRPGKKWNIRQG